MASSKKVLILSDGKLGHQNQSVRLVEKLGISDYDILTLERRKFGKPLSFISPIYIVKNLKELNQQVKNNSYDLVVGLGSVPRLAMVTLKSRNPDLKTICIMDPKRNYEYYDVIAVPNHDDVSYKGDNLVRITGSLSYFYKEDLEVAKEEFKEEFAPLIEKPLIGLIIGGDSKGYSFTMLKARDLLDKTLLLSKKIGSKVYATTSRRTPESQAAYIKYKIEDSKNEIYTSGKKNPFRAIMGYSSIIIVTPETVSMLMESCATEALTLIADRKGVKSARIQKFIQELIDKGVLFELEEMLYKDNILEYIEKAKSKPRFNELEKVVDFIKSKNIV
ncbi:MAG TPA: hypothetical protein DCL21_01775 [Alphaproteobacteria bacterium]|nr:hypothetical protein [Alphaproteobacteria bacterium]